MSTALSVIKKGNKPCPPNDIAREVHQRALCLRAEEKRTYLPKSIVPQGKQSPSEGMTGGACRLMGGRGREDDVAGGEQRTHL